MDLLQAVYESGDIKWLIPAMVGGLIVLLGLVRMLFSDAVGWALAMLIIFGGVLSGVSVITKASFGKEDFGLETVAAVSEASERLKDAVSANTDAIEGVQSAISEIRSFTEMLAAASSEAQGDLALTSSEIARYKSGVDIRLSETSAAISRSKEAELEAVRNLGILNEAIRQQRVLPVR